MTEFAAVRKVSIVGLILIGVLCVRVVPAAAQASSGSVAGSVKDQQNSVIPGATVSLISATRGTSTETTTNSNGDFSFTNVAGDTYTIKVTMDGFKTLERPNVPVSPGDRVVVPGLVIEVGALNETVTVTGDAPMIQAQSGERSFVVTTEAVQNLPVANRNFANLASIAPGVVGTTRLGGGGQNNYQIDGVSIMDTGNNGQMLQTNVEAIAEVKVVTQGYAAEYGRSSGLQISGVTKGGSNQLHGSVYDVQRHSRWDTNSWANTRNNITKALSDQHDRGYTFGGPIGKPGGQNKLFFFYAHEYRPRTSGGGTSRFRVPTVLERQGDFSQSTDKNGLLVNLIKDPTSTSPCTATNNAGCFQDGGVLGRIPANRLYPQGINILKLWPEPNAPGHLDYNYENKAPTDKRLTQQPTIRVDYQVSGRLRLTGKYTGQRATVKVNPGSIPGFNDTLSKFPFITNYSSTVDYAIGTGMVLEANWGFIRNQLGTPPVSPASNRCNVGLCDLPFLFPDAGLVNPDYYQKVVMDAINPPFYVDGRLMLPPTFSWGNQLSNLPPNITYPSFLNINRTNDVSISLTKLAGRHTAKAGFYLNHSYKAQNFGIGGSTPFQGNIDFSNDTNNPLNTGFVYANAAVGVFANYGQQSKLVEGGYLYNNIEWYAQDNWKMSDRLTLDYGLRFTHQQPQYDQFLQASNFFSDKWKAADAPQLYKAGCLTTSPCTGANRVAVNPVTGANLGPSTAAAIGTVITSTGSLTNGLIQAGKGIVKENYTWPALGVAPRFGAAYDLTGNQSMVLRGSVGLFFDRPDGNSIYNQVSNPPYSAASNVKFATLQSLAGGFQTYSAPQLSIYTYESPLPKTAQWNVGVQKTLPFAMAVDVSYVGNHGYDLLQAQQNSQPIDLNSVDFGAAFLPQNQDPTLAASSVPGARAVATDLMRTFRGYAAINAQMQVFHSTYHSIQTSLNRRFRNGVQFGANYTWGISTTGNVGSGSNPQPLRLQHNPDGTFSVRSDQAQLEELMKDNGNRPHTLRVNGVWDLPDLHSSLKVIQYVVNDWQIAGVLSAGSAAPYDASFSYNSNGGNVNLTGSPSYSARIKIVGDPGKGCSSNQYGQFNIAAFAAPSTGSLGLESGRNYLRGCADHTVDLAISRNIKLGAGRLVQFRLDMFNALNTVVFNARQSQLQLNSPTDLTVRNPQYTADGSLNQARLKPTDAGFGAVSGAQAMRTMQAQIRFQF